MSKRQTYIRRGEVSDNNEHKCRNCGVYLTWAELFPYVRITGGIWRWGCRCGEQVGTLPYRPPADLAEQMVLYRQEQGQNIDTLTSTNAPKVPSSGSGELSERSTAYRGTGAR